MAVIVKSFALSGVDAYLVDVEVNTNFGQPGITIIGMGDQSVKEASERIKATLLFNGYDYPESRVVINLAPSSIKKYGSHFDLAMAVGLLDQTGQLASSFVSGFIGELSLNGKIRGVRGVLPMVIEAKKNGIDHIIVPLENIQEAMLVKDVHILGFDDFKSMMNLLNGKAAYELPTFKEHEDIISEDYGIDFKDVKGSAYA